MYKYIKSMYVKTHHQLQKATSLLSKIKWQLAKNIAFVQPKGKWTNKNMNAVSDILLVKDFLLFVHLITIFIILIFALGSQCILIYSYKIFPEEKTGCATTKPDELFSNTKKMSI